MSIKLSSNLIVSVPFAQQPVVNQRVVNAALQALEAPALRLSRLT